MRTVMMLVMTVLRTVMILEMTMMRTVCTCVKILCSYMAIMAPRVKGVTESTMMLWKVVKEVVGS